MIPCLYAQLHCFVYSLVVFNSHVVDHVAFRGLVSASTFLLCVARGTRVGYSLLCGKVHTLNCFSHIDQSFD